MRLARLPACCNKAELPGCNSSSSSSSRRWRQTAQAAAEAVLAAVSEKHLQTATHLLGHCLGRRLGLHRPPAAHQHRDRGGEDDVGVNRHLDQQGCKGQDRQCGMRQGSRKGAVHVDRLTHHACPKTAAVCVAKGLSEGSNRRYQCPTSYQGCTGIARQSNQEGRDTPASLSCARPQSPYGRQVVSPGPPFAISRRSKAGQPLSSSETPTPQSPVFARSGGPPEALARLCIGPWALIEAWKQRTPPLGCWQRHEGLRLGGRGGPAALWQHRRGGRGRGRP